MKKTLLILGLLAGVAGAASVPAEIYQPPGARLLKAKHDGGDYEIRYKVPNGKVRQLAQQAIAQAEKHGYQLKEIDVDDKDGDIKLERGEDEMDISLELKHGHTVEYRVDLDKN